MNRVRSSSRVKRDRKVEEERFERGARAIPRVKVSGHATSVASGGEYELTTLSNNKLDQLELREGTQFPCNDGYGV